jgi:hypothetical protein
METDTPDNCVSNLKYNREGDEIRLTFRWPAAIPQVYIFKGTSGEFNISQARLSDARLYTLQEYKKMGGFMDKKTPGMHTYRVFPFIREDGEDVLVAQTDGENVITCLTGQVIIYFDLKERTSLLGREKVYSVKLSSTCEVGPDVVCYVKKEGGYPEHARDGTVYFFGEGLTPGQDLQRQIKTGKNEFIRLFIHDEAQEQLYALKLAL